MQLINHSSDFASAPFSPLDPRDFDSCKQAYDDYMEHVMGLLMAGGATSMPDVRKMMTSDGKEALDYIVDAIAYSDLAVGLLYDDGEGNRIGSSNEHVVEYLLGEGWDRCDANGYTGEDVTRSLAEDGIESYLAEMSGTRW